MWNQKSLVSSSLIIPKKAHPQEANAISSIKLNTIIKKRLQEKSDKILAM